MPRSRCPSRLCHLAALATGRAASAVFSPTRRKRIPFSNCGRAKSSGTACAPSPWATRRGPITYGARRNSAPTRSPCAKPSRRSSRNSKPASMASQSPDGVKRLLESKRAVGLSKRHLYTLPNRLNRFAGEHPPAVARELHAARCRAMDQCAAGGRAERQSLQSRAAFPFRLRRESGRVCGQSRLRHRLAQGRARRAAA